MILSGLGAAAAAATLVVALSLRDDPAPSTDDDGEMALPVDLDERVIAAVEQANATMIVHLTVAYANNEYNAYSDETSGSTRMLTLDADGTPVMDAHPAAVPTDQPSNRQAVAVDYCARQYSEIEALIDGPPNTMNSDAVRERIENGYLVEDGTEVVDGRELIRFTGLSRDVESVLDDGDSEEIDVRELDELPLEPNGLVLWVDPSTYRPVKEYDPTLPITRQFEYIERTPENLVEFMSPPIPAGFAHVDELPPFTGSCS